MSEPKSEVQGPRNADAAEASIEAPDPARALPEPEAGSGDAGEESQPETLYCSQCGGRMALADRFCNVCGWDAENPDKEPPGPVRPAAPVSPRDLGPLSSYNRATVFLLCLLLGFLGVHRFYVGKTGTGILWVFTLGFLGVGWIYDLVLVATGEFRDVENRRVWYWQ